MPEGLFSDHKNEISNAVVVYCPRVKHYSKSLCNRGHHLSEFKIKNSKIGTQNLTRAVHLRQNAAIHASRNTPIDQLVNNKAYKSCTRDYTFPIRKRSSHFRIINLRSHKILSKVKPYVSNNYSDAIQRESKSQMLVCYECFSCLVKIWKYLIQRRYSLLTRPHGVRYQRYQPSFQELSVFIHGYSVFERFKSYLLQYQIKYTTDRNCGDIRVILQTRHLLGLAVTANYDVMSSLQHVSIISRSNCHAVGITQYPSGYAKNLAVTLVSYKRKQTDVYYSDIYYGTHRKKQKLFRKCSAFIITDYIVCLIAYTHFDLITF